MGVTDVIELIGIVVAIIFGASSWFYSQKSKRTSEESIQIAKNANKLSEESIKISKEANALSERSIKIAEETMSINKENIELYSSYNPIILNTNSEKNKIVFIKKDYSDYILILKIQITNRSIQPVTIKNYSCYLGKEGNSMYLYFDKTDMMDIESYTTGVTSTKLENVNKFPVYLQANEMKEITIAVGLGNSEFQQYYARNGIQIDFETTNSSKEIWVSSENTILY